MTQRDLFLSKLFEMAKLDKNVILISPDMGAPMIDKWKSVIPDQFFSIGISEQNAINVASGFSSRGKKVYVYLMACWCARCFEQIRYSCSIGNNPITILGCGVGLGYAPAGPAHNPTDDISYMKSICNIEIFSPSTNQVVEQLVDYTYNNKKLVYIRLERTYNSSVDNFYTPLTFTYTSLNEGIFKPINNSNADCCIVTSGYLLDRSIEVSKKLNCDVIDLFKLPINVKSFLSIINPYKYIFCLEEQTSNCGGLCSSVCQTLMENGFYKNITNIQLPEKYIFENGNRDDLLNKYGFSIDNIQSKIKCALK